MKGLRRTLDTPKIVVLVVAAAAPMAALVGTVPLAFAIGDGAGVPAMFAAVGLILLCFSVGYAAMSRRIVNAGGFYTYISSGLGKPPAVAGGLVAVLSYNAICIGLVGAFGYFLRLGLEQQFHLNVPWQVLAAIVIAAVAMLGYRQIDVSARVLKLLMAAEIAVLLILDIFVIARNGGSAFPRTSLAPKTIFGGAVGVTMMFAFSSYIGFESAALYGEEAHDPRRSVPLATYVSVIVIAVFYSFTSWVAVGAVGPAHLHSTAKAELGNLFFKISDKYATSLLTTVMQVLLITSLFAATLALHNAANRYMFALGREKVLPGVLGTVHGTHQSPHRASLAQTGITVVVVAAFALAGLDPYLNLATSMIGLGTLGIVTLQAAASLSVLGFFRNRPDRAWWRTVIAPALGTIGLITGVVLLASNFRVLVGTGNIVVNALPAGLLTVAIIGVCYGLWLRRYRPQRYAVLAAVAQRDTTAAGEPDAPPLEYPVPRTAVTDPPAEYVTAQHSRPVCPVKLATGYPALLVTRYEDVKAVLSDARFSRDALFEPGAPRSQLAEPDQDSIISIDPPRHTRLRSFVNREFSPRRVAQMRPAIQACVDELLDGMGRKSPPLDLNEHLSRPLALQVICDLLGVPYADHPRFGSWCDHFVSYAKYPVDEVIRANTEMRDYLSQLIEAKRVTSDDDLLSALIRARDGAALSQNELVSLGVILLLAGHDTTITAIGGGMITLLRNPEQLAELRREPSLIPQAVEELLRLNEPGDGSFLRIATSDVDLNGTTIPAGSAVIASISTANRDPSVFDQPHRLDIHRNASPHIAFGHGPHFCIGSALARAEMQIALTGLLARFPGLELAVPFENLRWRSHAHLGGIEEVPVRW